MAFSLKLDAEVNRPESTRVDYMIFSKDVTSVPGLILFISNSRS